MVGRGWGDGTVELRDRFSGQTREIAVHSAAEAISAALAEN